MIKDIALFGERHSGTNITTALLKNNLNIPLTSQFGAKHWYIKNFENRPPSNTTTDMRATKNIYTDLDNTLFLLLIRHPFTWVPAMYKLPHHMPSIDRSSMMNFVKSEAMSYGKRSGNRPNWKPNENRIYFMEKHKNIIIKYNLILKTGNFTPVKYRFRNYKLSNEIDEIYYNFNRKIA